MKKVLSFVLVLAMILGSVSVAFATPLGVITKAKEKLSATNTALPFADAKDNAVTTILRDLGVVDGDSNGNINVADGLTRAEAAALIVKAMGFGDQGAVQTTTKFADVKKADWFSGYVAVAAANGYVDGYNGKFNPNGKLTLDDAITLVVKALGYDAANLSGTWPFNYRDVAETLGILAESKAKFCAEVNVGSGLATRGDLFNLLYNCIAGNVEFKVWKYVETTGYAQFVTIPYGAKTLLKRITGTTEKWENAAYQFVEVDSLAKEAYKFVNGFDASAFYGHPVTVILKATETAATTSAIGVAANKAKVTVTGTFAKNDKLATFTAIDGTVYTGLTLDKGATIVENGATKATNGNTAVGEYVGINKLVTYTLTLKCDKTTPEKNASITSIAYEQVNCIVMANATDAALLANENLYVYKEGYNVQRAGYTEVLAKALGTTNAGLKKNAVLDQVKYPLVIEGAATKLSEIKENDIIEIYYPGGNTENKASKLVVTRNVVTGPITNVGSDAADHPTYTVNGTEYKRGSNTVTGFADITGTELTGAIKGATEYAFYLDANGKIAYIKSTVKATTAKYKYAFVLSAKNVHPIETIDGENYNVTKMAITLLPLDTMVKKTYTFSTKGAVTVPTTTDFFFATDSDAQWGSFATQTDVEMTLVQYYDVDGVLKGLKEADTTDAATAVKAFYKYTGATSAKFTASKFNGKQFSNSAKVYLVATSTDRTFASEAAYKLVTVAEMNKATTKNYMYKCDANGYVDTVIVFDYDFETISAQVTAAAFVAKGTDANGTWVKFVQAGSDAEEVLYATSGAILPSFNKASIYTFELEGGKIMTATVAAYELYSGDSAKNVEYDNVKLLKSGDFYQQLDPTTMFIGYNADAKVRTNLTTLEEINDAFEETNVEFYIYRFEDADFDVVVITYDNAD